MFVIQLSLQRITLPMERHTAASDTLTDAQTRHRVATLRHDALGSARHDGHASEVTACAHPLARLEFR